MGLSLLFRQKGIALDASLKDEPVADCGFAHMFRRSNKLTRIGGYGVAQIVNQCKQPRSNGTLIDSVVETVVEFEPAVEIGCLAQFVEYFFERFDLVGAHLGDGEAGCHALQNAAQKEDLVYFG